jgi:hypothetical protein
MNNSAGQDRNLLFGVLALQIDLIDERQFAQACAAWATRKETPLADVLKELGWLTDEDCRAVEALAERKLKKHGGDPRLTLAHVADAGARDALRSLGDEDVNKSISSLPPAAGYVLLETTDHPSGQRSRYTLTRLHGEGGLGQVWVGHDNDLDREVAIKQIKPGRAAHPEMFRRFLKEAKITGQLEHPNIVPVYELGRGADDQQPFYAMRFVRGRTLREAIAEYHAKRRAGTEDPLDRPRLLQSFISVCQAINYAHEHGVIHRDLKPANVVLGRYGEVVVLDWGLAKVVGQAEESATRISSDDAPADATQAGQALGSPAYMAPEQAEGRIDLVDRRTDIYGLGAMLFEILTGRAPHGGIGTSGLLRRIAAGETPLARGVNPTVPPPLEAVCARAMARDRAARYESPAALAEDVQRWLADEPVKAYPEPLRARIGRKLRRHRGLVAAAAVVLVSVAAVSSVLAAEIYREKVRAEGAETTARTEKEKAEAAEQVALQQSDVAIEALDNVIMEVQAELKDTPGSYVSRQQIIKMAMARLKQLNDIPATNDRVRRRHLFAHMQIADLHWELAERPQAHPEYLIAYELAQRAAEANPASDKARYNRYQMGLRLGRSELYYRENAAEAERLYSQSVSGLEELAAKLRALPDGDPGLPPAERMTLFDVEEQLAYAYGQVGEVYSSDKDLSRWDLNKYEEYVKKGLAIRERLVAVRPTADMRRQLADSYLYLSNIAFRRNDMAGCIRHNEKLLKQRLALLKERPTSLRAKNDLSHTEYRLGDALSYVGQRERALELYTDGLKWAEQVRWSEPESPWYRAAVYQGHYCVATVLPKTERAKALDHWREALKLREELYREAQAKGITRTQDKNALALTLARCGEIKRAAAIADEARAKADPRELTEEVAAVYGLCMEAVEAGRPLDRLSPEERKLRDYYRDRAMETIKEGVGKGYRGYLQLEGDPDHDPIRALPEFKEWFAEYKKGLNLK